jgi:hypothetical protein
MDLNAICRMEVVLDRAVAPNSDAAQRELSLGQRPCFGVTVSSGEVGVGCTAVAETAGNYKTLLRVAVIRLRYVLPCLYSWLHH